MRLLPRSRPRSLHSARNDDTGATDAGAAYLFTASMVMGLEKEITEGSDVDGDGNIDVVVEVGQTTTTEYDFDITYTNPGDADVLIVDTVPAPELPWPRL